ncbi:hypothetical protein H6P81_002064 [Aristolochia fimbriata]|uniref:Uncharacterized protein n=1 Tax=Aristolochia fimbriata TaxID=158543 RepID=A0AAV7FBX7_ARIFI|nr:hypothetical protein H6P81_002064 [Aristolochia fimbriata]
MAIMQTFFALEGGNTANALERWRRITLFKQYHKQWLCMSRRSASSSSDKASVQCSFHLPFRSWRTGRRELYTIDCRERSLNAKIGAKKNAFLKRTMGSQIISSLSLAESIRLDLGLRHMSERELLHRPCPRICPSLLNTTMPLTLQSAVVPPRPQPSFNMRLQQLPPSSSIRSTVFTVIFLSVPLSLDVLKAEAFPV